MWGMWDRIRGVTGEEATAPAADTSAFKSTGPYAQATKPLLAELRGVKVSRLSDDDFAKLMQRCVEYLKQSKQPLLTLHLLKQSMSMRLSGNTPVAMARAKDFNRWHQQCLDALKEQESLNSNSVYTRLVKHFNVFLSRRPQPVPYDLIKEPTKALDGNWLQGDLAAFFSERTSMRYLLSQEARALLLGHLPFLNAEDALQLLSDYRTYVGKYWHKLTEQIHPSYHSSAVFLRYKAKVAGLTQVLDKHIKVAQQAVDEVTEPAEPSSWRASLSSVGASLSTAFKQSAAAADSAIRSCASYVVSNPGKVLLGGIYAQAQWAQAINVNFVAPQHPNATDFWAIPYSELQPDCDGPLKPPVDGRYYSCTTPQPFLPSGLEVPFIDWTSLGNYQAPDSNVTEIGIFADPVPRSARGKQAYYAVANAFNCPIGSFAPADACDLIEPYLLNMEDVKIPNWPITYTPPASNNPLEVHLNIGDNQVGQALTQDDCTASEPSAACLNPAVGQLRDEDDGPKNGVPGFLQMNCVLETPTGAVGGLNDYSALAPGATYDPTTGIVRADIPAGTQSALTGPYVQHCNVTDFCGIFNCMGSTILPSGKTATGLLPMPQGVVESYVLLDIPLVLDNRPVTDSGINPFLSLAYPPIDDPAVVTRAIDQPGAPSFAMDPNEFFLDGDPGDAAASTDTFLERLTNGTYAVPPKSRFYREGLTNFFVPTHADRPTIDMQICRTDPAGSKLCKLFDIKLANAPQDLAGAYPPFILCSTGQSSPAKASVPIPPDGDGFSFTHLTPPTNPQFNLTVGQPNADGTFDFTCGEGPSGLAAITINGQDIPPAGQGIQPASSSTQVKIIKTDSLPSRSTDHGGQLSFGKVGDPVDISVAHWYDEPDQPTQKSFVFEGLAAGLTGHSDGRITGTLAQSPLEGSVTIRVTGDVDGAIFNDLVPYAMANTAPTVIALATRMAPREVMIDPTAPVLVSDIATTADVDGQTTSLALSAAHHNSDHITATTLGNALRLSLSDGAQGTGENLYCIMMLASDGMATTPDAQAAEVCLLIVDQRMQPQFSLLRVNRNFLPDGMPLPTTESGALVLRIGGDPTTVDLERAWRNLDISAGNDGSSLFYTMADGTNPIAALTSLPSAGFHQLALTARSADQTHPNVIRNITLWAHQVFGEAGNATGRPTTVFYRYDNQPVFANNITLELPPGDERTAQLNPDDLDRGWLTVRTLLQPEYCEPLSLPTLLAGTALDLTCRGPDRSIIGRFLVEFCDLFGECVRAQAEFGTTFTPLDTTSQTVTYVTAGVVGGGLLVMAIILASIHHRRKQAAKEKSLTSQYEALVQSNTEASTKAERSKPVISPPPLPPLTIPPTKANPFAKDSPDDEIKKDSEERPTSARQHTATHAVAIQHLDPAMHDRGIQSILTYMRFAPGEQPDGLIDYHNLEVKLAAACSDLLRRRDEKKQALATSTLGTPRAKPKSATGAGAGTGTRALLPTTSPWDSFEAELITELGKIAKAYIAVMHNWTCSDDTASHIRALAVVIKYLAHLDIKRFTKNALLSSSTSTNSFSFTVHILINSLCAAGKTTTYRRAIAFVTMTLLDIEPSLSQQLSFNTDDRKMLLSNLSSAGLQIFATATGEQITRKRFCRDVIDHPLTIGAADNPALEHSTAALMARIYARIHGDAPTSSSWCRRSRAHVYSTHRERPLPGLADVRHYGKETASETIPPLTLVASIKANTVYFALANLVRILEHQRSGPQDKGTALVSIILLWQKDLIISTELDRQVQIASQALVWHAVKELKMQAFFEFAFVSSGTGEINEHAKMSRVQLQVTEIRDVLGPLFNADYARGKYPTRDRRGTAVVAPAPAWTTTASASAAPPPQHWSNPLRSPSELSRRQPLSSRSSLVSAPRAKLPGSANPATGEDAFTSVL